MSDIFEWYIEQKISYLEDNWYNTRKKKDYETPSEYKKRISTELNVYQDILKSYKNMKETYPENIANFPNKGVQENESKGFRKGSTPQDKKLT